MNDHSGHPPHPHVVHDAVGVDLDAREAAAGIAMGAISLLMAGVLPALLGALADEGRLGASGIGLCATLEALAMGLTTAIAGMALKPQRIRAIGFLATLALVGIDLGCIGLHGTAILMARSAAGIAEGMLLWITVGMIARTETPERWAGALFTASTGSQLVLALAFATVVIPRHGADGGFAALAIATLPGAAIACFCPRKFAPLPGSEGAAGLPPPRGWAALLATLLYASAAGAIGIYLQPLAHQAGLSADVARTALWISLAAQIAGASAATAMAGRVRYFTVFVGAAIAFLATWLVFALPVPAWLFIAANAVGGFVFVFMSPFLVPLAVEADPSRRTAVQSAGAQLLAGALGPFLSSRIVSDRNVHGALALGSVLLIGGTILIGALHFASVREQAAIRRL